MRAYEKEERLKDLWYKTLAKLKGAFLVTQIFEALRYRIYLFGTSKKQKFAV